MRTLSFSTKILYKDLTVPSIFSVVNNFARLQPWGLKIFMPYFSWKNPAASERKHGGGDKMRK